MLRILMIALLMLSGCTYSTHPIFNEQDNEFDEALVGAWQAEEEMTDVGTFDVTRWAPDDNSYRVVVRNQANAKQATIRFYLSRIGQAKFLTAQFENPTTNKPNADEASTEKTKSEDSAVADRYLTFVFDQFAGGQLKVRYLRADWLTGQIKSNPRILKHEWIDRPGNPKIQDLLLTASTTELRAFVLSQLDKRDPWMPMTFKKIR